MPLKVGDQVKTAYGLKGEIVLLTKDGISAYVRLNDGLPNARAILYGLVELAKVGTD